MNHLVGARKSFSAVLLESLVESAASAAPSSEAFLHSRPGKQMDWLAGWLWLPMAASPVPWACQSPTFHLARDL